MKEVIQVNENEIRINENERKTERTRCEVYSRIVGYIRPVNQWNKGKAEEFKDRNLYDKSVKEKKESEIKD